MAFQAFEQRHSILVVDDNPADVFMIQEAFLECGYRCHLKVATLRTEAQHLLATEPFDLLISDFGIDVEEGQSFVRSVRAQKPCLPIIILSGGYIVYLAYEAGANAFLHKPSDLQEFTAKIRGLMNFWVNVAELPTASETEP
jgi:DNA-binding response OmpR family regulator